MPLKRKLNDRKFFFLVWENVEGYGELKGLVIESLLEGLYQLSLVSHEVLDNLNMLKNEDFGIVLRMAFNTQAFKLRLRDRKLLPLVWERVQRFDFLRNAVVAFCADPQNNDVVKRAWFPMPDELKTAIAELGEDE